MKILNFGSLNIDYVYTVDHIVKPGETLSSAGLEVFCGGKGLNQSVALKRAKADVYHGGMVGKDGDLLISYCRKNGINTEHIKMTDTPTGNAIIQVDSKGENSIILYGGANRQITKAFADEVLSRFSKDDMLVLQNEINLIGYIIEKAYEKGMAIALNPAPVDGALHYDLSKVTHLVLNETEGYGLTEETEPHLILDKIAAAHPHLKTVLTLGAKGCMYKDSHTSLFHEAYNVKAVDTTGAGDTFFGYYIAQTIIGKSVYDSLKIASKAASLTVSKKGAADSIPYLEDICLT